MKRTQIYLSDDLYFEIKRRSKKSKKSISEIIRQTLRENLIPSKKDEILSSINKAFGLWKDRKFDAETYIREIRKGERLDNLGY